MNQIIPCKSCGRPTAHLTSYCSRRCFLCEKTRADRQHWENMRKAFAIWAAAPGPEKHAGVEA